MTPELARYIRLARNHLLGTPINEEDEKHAVALDQFKLFLARRIELQIRFELFSQTVWQGGPEGCSLQFTVDNQRYLLAEKGKKYELLRQTDAEKIVLAVLEDDTEFQDRVLIAIDDAIRKEQSV